MKAFPFAPCGGSLPKKQQKVTREALVCLRDVKNEGASGDVHENKGTGKFQVARPRGAQPGTAIDHPVSGEVGACEQNPLLPCSVSHLPYPASLKMKVHPAMFMKTKERENSMGVGREDLAGELPLIIPFPAKWVPVSRIHFSLVL